MELNSLTPEEFIQSLPEDRKEPITKLREVIIKNLPSGFTEMVGQMIMYVVPFSIYPDGYHCPPRQPLPFMSIGSQKNYVALYHMGIYADKKLLNWFVDQYPNYAKRKVDMGKSCIRFKKMDDIPFELIGQLVTKMSCQEWIDMYENRFKKA